MVAVIVLGSVTGLGAVTVQSGLALDQANSGAAATAARCYYCGVVERVREIENAGPRYDISTVTGGRDQGIVLLLGALSGTKNIAPEPRKIYEVTVLMDDGSIRAVRGGRLPEWTVGDRVKVVKGRVERM
jgi:hypothetical protein